MDELFPVAAHVSRLTVNIDDDDVTLFEHLWPVTHGVALHAYLVEGKRRVLIDPWNAGGYGLEEIEADLQSRDLTWKDIDAVAFTKPADAALLAKLKDTAPSVVSWGTPASGVRHDLGGAALVEKDGFWFAEPAGVVFTGEALAGLGWVDDAWADDLSTDAARHTETEALRWFCGRPLVPDRLPEKTSIVAPAHGWLWRNPDAALERARKFARWAEGDALGEIAVIWPAGKDYDEGFDALIGAAMEEGAGLNLFRVPGDDPMAVAAGARRSSLIVVAAGVDESFLAGLKKDVWRPDPSSPHLRTELADHWGVA